MLRHHTPTKQSTATELSTSASNFLNEGLQSKIQATKTKKAKGEKIYSCAQHHTTTTEGEHKAFHSKKQNTETIFDPRSTNKKFLNDSADKETFTASQAKKKKNFDPRRQRKL